MPGRQPLIRGPRGITGIVVVSGVLLASTVLPSCGRSVSVEPADDGQACAAVIAALPGTVAGEQRRDVIATGAAAWGDPPITLRCGVDLPATYTPTSQLIDAEGVAWLSETVDGGSRFTSVRTSPRIEVSVPAVQEPASAALVDLAAVLVQLPQAGPAS